MFSGDAVLIGHKAVLQSDHNPTNTLYDAKRFIGKQFTSDELNSESSHYPFKVNISCFVCQLVTVTLPQFGGVMFSPIFVCLFVSRITRKVYG